MKIKNSERLCYELMGPNDAELLFQLDQDVEVMRFINGGKMTSREDVDKVFLPRMLSYTNLEKGWGLWKVTVVKTNQYIGWILVRPLDFFGDHPQWDNLELGWRFMQKSWGHGYATEAAQHTMQSLNKKGVAKHFSAIVLPDNLASIGIMKKLGMKYIKTYLNKDPLGDIEVAYYEIQFKD